MNLKHISLIIVCSLITACGFEPLYGTKPESSALDSKVLADLAGIEIAVPTGRLGAQFRRDLEDRLNPGRVVAANPTYRLLMDLSMREEPVGIARDGSISRYNIFIETYFQLRRRSDDQPVLQGRFSRVASYSVQANVYYSTYVSRDDALKRGITEMAEEFRQRLSSFLVQNPSPKPIQVVPLPNSAKPPELFPDAAPGAAGTIQR